MYGRDCKAYAAYRLRPTNAIRLHGAQQPAKNDAIDNHTTQNALPWHLLVPIAP